MTKEEIPFLVRRDAMAAVKPTFAAYSTIASVVVYETEGSGVEWEMML
jgi:hypothetical protein